MRGDVMLSGTNSAEPRSSTVNLSSQKRGFLNSLEVDVRPISKYNTNLENIYIVYGLIAFSNE